MTAERPFWIRAQIPKKVLDELLQDATHAWRPEEWVFQHYAPISIAQQALEASNEEVEWVLNEAFRWLRDERRGTAAPAPTDEELAAHFGADGVLVSTIWPVIRFAKSVRDEEFDDLKLWEEARLLLLLFRPAKREPGNEWINAVDLAVQRVVKGRGGAQRRELVLNIAQRLLNTPQRSLTYKPSGTTRKVVKTFLKAIRNLAIDLHEQVVRDVDPKSVAGFETDVGGYQQTSTALRPSTLRGYRFRKLIGEGAPPEKIDAVRRENERRAHHRPPEGWVSLSQLARLEDRPLSTVRDVVHKAVAREEIAPPREFARAKGISRADVPLVRALLSQVRMKAADGVSLDEAAAALKLTRRETLALIRMICAADGEPLPKVRRKYRLSVAWMDQLRRECDQRRR